MLILKLLALSITLFSGVIQFALENFWHNEKTKLHKRIKIVLLSLMILSGVFAVSLEIVDDRDTKEQEKRLIDIQLKTEKEAKEAARREKDAKEDLSQVMNELKVLQEKLGPFVKLASARYPNESRENALSRLAEDVANLKNLTSNLETKTEVLSNRDFFKKLSSTIRETIVGKLKNITLSNAEVPLKISILCENGNSGRQLVADELWQILNAANIKTDKPLPQTTFSKTILPPIKITLNPMDVKIAEQMAMVLHPFLSVNFQGIKDEKIERGKLVFSIYGEPIFFSDGSVKFK